MLECGIVYAVRIDRNGHCRARMVVRLLIEVGIGAARPVRSTMATHPCRTQPGPSRDQRAIYDVRAL